MEKYFDRGIGVAVVIGVFTMASGCVSMAQKGALSSAQKSYAKGDYPDCVIKLDRATGYGQKSEAVSAQILFYKGLCLDGDGRKPEAKVMYRTILKNYPNSEPAAQAKARLGE